MTTTPLPCPFCWHVGLEFREGSSFRWLLAECGSCGASCGETRIQTAGNGNPLEWADAAKTDAIKQWNERAPATAPAGHDSPEVATLKAERDAAMKDAERYRWLRDATPWTAISAFDMTRVAFRLASKLSEEAEPDSGVELDAAIDAAIAKAEGRKE